MPEEVKPKTMKIACPICKGEDFKEDKVFLNVPWKIGTYIMSMRICKRCSNVIFFSEGKRGFLGRKEKN